MKEDLQKIIEHENANWSKVFSTELDKNSDQKFSSFWWESYYNELTNSVNEIMLADSLNTILEAGSGSGKATLLLNKKFDKTLLDISPVALEYAKHIANKFGVENINFVEGNIFSMYPIQNSLSFIKICASSSSFIFHFEKSPSEKSSVKNTKELAISFMLFRAMNSVNPLKV